jgi:molybdopterin converting factor small subunit
MSETFGDRMRMQARQQDAHGATLRYSYAVTKVTVRFFSVARVAAGCDEVMVDPGPLEEIIDGLHVTFPALAAVTPRCSFLVDGLSAKRHSGAPIVGARSSVDVLPPFAGG